MRTFQEFRMKILKAEFTRSCVSPEHFPNGDVPEIALVGRSNVGKSSLINSLLQRKALAKVSRTPGKTRVVNVFSVATDDAMLPHLLMVDLPGYGYAKVAKSVRAQWGPMIESYLTQPARRRTVVLLVESRVPVSQDRHTMIWLRSIGYLPVVVATKVDKLKPSARIATLRRLEAELGLHEDESFTVYSSMTGEGRDQLWGLLKERSRT